MNCQDDILLHFCLQGLGPQNTKQTVSSYGVVQGPFPAVQGPFPVVQGPFPMS